jgi:hypothetical protein
LSSLLFIFQLDFWKYSFIITGVECLLLLLVWFLPHLSHTKKFVISIITCVGFFLCIVFLFSFNTPITDDYFALLDWAVRLKTNGDTFGELVVPYNESRIVFARSIVLLDLYLFKELNFTHLIFVAVIGLLLIAFLFIREVKDNLCVALSIVFLLFQFQYYDSILWANSALQNVWSLLFGMFAIKLLLSNKQSHFSFLIAVVVITVFTYGNGFCLIPIILVYQLIQKRFFRAAILSGVSVLIIVLYFNNFTSLASNALWQKTMLNLIPFSLVFLGSSFQFMYQMYLPVVFGALIYVCLILMLKVKFYKTNPFIFLVLVYVLLCSLMAGYFRSSREVIEWMSVRYGIYSVLAVICCVIFLFKTYPLFRNKGAKYLLAASIIFHFASNFFFFPEVVLRKQKLQIFTQSLCNPDAIWTAPPVIPFSARKILQKATSEGIYITPQLSTDSCR